MTERDPEQGTGGTGPRSNCKRATPVVKKVTTAKTAPVKRVMRAKKTVMAKKKVAKKAPTKKAAR
ncbi:MAG TPA: hypothetical protein P5244_08635 [Syntrophales bacterium]|nr:hypothetical protein [Syntrophales bacterium]